MLRLPTNAGEWGFVIVLAVLFAGLAFGTIYSQVHLHNMRREQACRDTETNLHVLAEQVRAYRMQHGRTEDTLTKMGVTEESLQTRHADFANEVSTAEGRITIRAVLVKYNNATCTLTFNLEDESNEFAWTE